MSVYRCPKHTHVTFEAQNPPTLHGHKKCPQCAIELGLAKPDKPAAPAPAAAAADPNEAATD